MAGTNLTFSKVVATPTPTAWSQAYSAGSLFAAFSLQTDTIPQTESDNLSSLGKDLISTLESEFFTLENKDLESIKQAIGTTVSRVNNNIKQSFVICYLNDNVLYLYAAGGGKAILKRGEKIGTVLEGEETENIKSASGYVQNGDFIVLQTKPFQRIISSPTLASSLDKSTPEEIAEEIAPHVHDKSEGGASAVILNYREGGGEEITESIANVAAVQTTTEVSGEENIQDEEPINESSETIENINEATQTQNIQTENLNDQPIQNPKPVDLPPTPTQTQDSYTPEQSPKKKRSLGFGKLSRGRKLILFVGLIIIVLLIITSVFAINKKQNANNQELFTGIITEAQSKYDEGVSLKELNASLSQESFKKAQSILLENKDTFPDGSSEDQQIEALLTQVNSQLGGTGSTTDSGAQATEVDKSESEILSVQIDNPESDYFTQNKNFIYFIDSKGVNSIDKGNSSKELVIKNDWKEEGGIGVFGSNIYVLDKTDNIFKFVPSGSDFAKSSYISSDPDLKDAAAMGIDGSIYVLKSNGNIDKYTKGAKEDFSITGLDKPLSSPTRIQTTEDSDNLYILDNNNSRIVVLDKTGKFVKAYGASILKNARDIDVKEADKKILVLSDGKVYKIDIQ